MADNQEEGGEASNVQNIDLNLTDTRNLFVGAEVHQHITHETKEFHTHEIHEHHVQNIQAEKLFLGDVHYTQGNVQEDDITEADSTSDDVSLETIKEDLTRPQQEVVPLGLNYKQDNFPRVNPALRKEKNFYRGSAGKTEKYKPSTQKRYDDSGSDEISVEQWHESVIPNRYTALVGAPGSGKSTIARRLSKTSCIIWILLFCMNMHYGSQNVTLRQVVVDHAYPWLSARKRNNIFAAMMKFPEKFGIIIEGYDQATWSLDNVMPRNASYDTPMLVEEVVANLCSGKFLPGISIVLTSRPHSIVTLHEVLRPKEIVFVHELTPENMKKLFFAFAQNEAQRIWNSFTKLAPVLLELCLTPIMLQLILLAALGTDNLTDLCNITQIFTILLENLRRSEYAKGGDINLIKVKFTKIAYNATKNLTVIMTYPQMAEEGLSDVIVQDIVIAVPGYSHFNQKLFDGDKKFYFSHQTWQEFFTALHISQNMSLDEFFQIVKKLVSDPHWAMVRRFECGLLLDTNFIVPESDEIKRQSTVLQQQTPPAAMQRKILPVFETTQSGSVMATQAYNQPGSTHHQIPSYPHMLQCCFPNFFPMQNRRPYIPTQLNYLSYPSIQQRLNTSYVQPQFTMAQELWTSFSPSSGSNSLSHQHLVSAYNPQTYTPPTALEFPEDLQTTVGFPLGLDQQQQHLQFVQQQQLHLLHEQQQYLQQQHLLREQQHLHRQEPPQSALQQGTVPVSKTPINPEMTRQTMFGPTQPSAPPPHGGAPYAQQQDSQGNTSLDPHFNIISSGAQSTSSYGRSERGIESCSSHPTHPQQGSLHPTCAQQQSAHQQQGHPQPTVRPEKPVTPLIQHDVGHNVDTGMANYQNTPITATKTRQQTTAASGNLSLTLDGTSSTQQVANQPPATPPATQPSQLETRKATMFYEHFLQEFKRKPRDIGMIVDLQECNEGVLQSFAKHFPVRAYFIDQPIGTSSAHALGQMLQHVDKPMEVLHLFGCKLTSQGLEHICEAIGKMTHKLEKLYLSQNHFGNVGVQHLSKIVDKVEVLWLDNCDITDISELTEAIENKQCKLKELNLRKNHLGNVGVQHLSKIVDKVEVLWLDDCDITDISELTEAIENKQCKIKKLDLGRNRFGDEGAHELSRVLSNIDKLSVSGCGFTKEGEQVIRSKLRELGLPEDRVKF